MESFNYSLEELICLVGASKTCDYKHLKRNYLAPAIQIINEKTDINVTFTENKKGRKVTSLAFSVGMTILHPTRMGTSLYGVPRLPIPSGGALVSTGMLKPKWQAEAPLASLKAAP